MDKQPTYFETIVAEIVSSQLGLTLVLNHDIAKKILLDNVSNSITNNAQMRDRMFEMISDRVNSLLKEKEKKDD